MSVCIVQYLEEFTFTLCVFHASKSKNNISAQISEKHDNLQPLSDIFYLRYVIEEVLGLNIRNVYVYEKKHHELREQICVDLRNN